MADNASKMTLEDKLVQTLKDEKLFALVADEDAIAELVKRAIHEALYQPKRITKAYGSVDYSDSIVVAAAREVAQKAATDLSGKMIAELINDPAIMKGLNDALAAALPAAIEGTLSAMVYNMKQSSVSDALIAVQDAIRNKTILLS